jgi:phage gpG-like protein
MSGVMSLAGFASLLQEAVRSMPVLLHAAMEHAAQVVEAEAKRVIGTHEYGWPPLAESTLARKSADTPLLETGEMRDSIEHYSSFDNAVIGSNNDKAVWHELGTNRIPPRPFLSGAAQHKAEEVRDIIAETVIGHLKTGNVNMGHGLPPNPHSSTVKL